MKIVSFIGNIGSGKGYQMSQYMEKVKSNGNPVLCMSFADPIKEHIEHVFGLRRDGTKDEAVFNRFINAVDMYPFKHELAARLFYIHQTNNGAISEAKLQELYKQIEPVADQIIEFAKSEDVRKCMQYHGTEYAQTLDNLIWPKFLIKKIIKLLDLKFIDARLHILIDDMRFIQEYDYLKDMSKEHQFEFECYGVTASEKVRAKRRGVKVKELREMEQHESEKQIKLILEKDDVIIIENN